MEPPWFAGGDIHADGLEQTHDAAAFRGPRSVVVARDHHDVRVGQSGAQLEELAERVQDRRVRGARAVEHVAGDDDQLGRYLDDAIEGSAKRVRHVRLALIDPSWSETLILPIAEVEIRKMDEAHPTTNLVRRRPPEHTHLLRHSHAKLGRRARRIRPFQRGSQIHHESRLRQPSALSIHHHGPGHGTAHRRRRQRRHPRRGGDRGDRRRVHRAVHADVREFALA